METPYFEKIADFSCVMCMDIWWFCPMWPKCAFGYQKCLIHHNDMSFGNSPHHDTNKMQTFCKMSIFSFFTFYGPKSGILGYDS